MKIKYVFLFFLLLLFCQTSGFGQKSIGILYNKENIPIKIIRNHNPLLFIPNPTEIFQEDKIISRKLDKLIFSWAPYAHGTKINDTTMEATEIAPEKAGGLLSRIAETISNYLGFIKEDFLTRAVAQRSNEVNESPEPLITAIDFLPVKFSNTTGEVITISDKNDKVIFKKEIKKDKPFDILPQKLDLKPDSIYTWKITDKENVREGKIKMLDKNTQSLIKANFGLIDKETKNRYKRIIKKASFLEMISDIYEKELDLYWLSNQMLGGIDFSKYPEVQYIESRYYQHTKKQ